MIDEAPPVDGLTFDPVRLIRVVNHLWGLGHDGALTALREYVTAAHRTMTTHRDGGLGGERVFLVIRLLFLPKDEGHTMPVVRLGLPDFAPVDQAHWPLFPLALSSDIPFLLVGAYSLGGLPDTPMSHIDFCERHGRLRSGPLAPQTSPVDAVVEVLSALRRADSEATVASLRGRLYGQALRAMRPLYNTPSDELDALATGHFSTVTQLWERHANAILAISPQWNPQTQEFTAGTHR